MSTINQPEIFSLERSANSSIESKAPTEVVPAEAIRQKAFSPRFFGSFQGGAYFVNTNLFFRVDGVSGPI
jgi:hypothetical protein